MVPRNLLFLIIYLKFKAIHGKFLVASITTFMSTFFNIIDFCVNLPGDRVQLFSIVYDAFVFLRRISSKIGKV